MHATAFQYLRKEHLSSLPQTSRAAQAMLEHRWLEARYKNEHVFIDNTAMDYIFLAEEAHGLYEQLTGLNGTLSAVVL